MSEKKNKKKFLDKRRGRFPRMWSRVPFNLCEGKTRFCEFLEGRKRMIWFHFKDPLGMFVRCHNVGDGWMTSLECF